MISHIHIGVDDLDRAVTFYDAVLSVLGLVRRFRDDDRGWAGWQTPGVPRPLLLVGRPVDGRAASPGNGQMIALLAPDRASVDRCHAAALAAGGRDDGTPGLRPHYHRDYYGAYFRDPEGNKLCICCHQPEASP